jgi:uncharacterized protein (DUF427 family)
VTRAARPAPIVPAVGQESVWNYPRPPRLEPVPERLRVVLAGVTVAETMAGWRVLETSHPPTYYFPPAAILPGSLAEAAGQSWCEWKGRAGYLDVVAGGRRAVRAAWRYRDPTAPFAAIRDHVAFHAALLDSCWVGDERVTPQEGGFYGGWITSRIVGPCKGGPGTQGW